MDVSPPPRATRDRRLAPLLPGPRDSPSPTRPESLPAPLSTPHSPGPVTSPLRLHPDPGPPRTHSPRAGAPGLLPKGLPPAPAVSARGRRRAPDASGSLGSPAASRGPGAPAAVATVATVAVARGTGFSLDAGRGGGGLQDGAYASEAETSAPNYCNSPPRETP